MKRVLAFVFACVCLSACSGNPPAWWNPNNRYGTAEETEKTTAKAEAQTQATQPQRKAVAKEEQLELIDVSYEEEDIILTPMPDEDSENKTGIAAAQNEELTPDNVLPPPSILD